MEYCYDTCYFYDSCNVTFSWEGNQTWLNCSMFYDFVDDNNEDGWDDYDNDTWFDEECSLQCHEMDYSNMFDLDFAWMRQCIDTCQYDEITCFMEWSNDEEQHYDMCDSFYYWYDDYFNND